MANRMRKSGSNDRFSFLGLQKSLGTVTTALKLKDAWSLEGKLWETYFPNKGPYSESYGFWNLKSDRMIFVSFQGKPFNITVIQVYAPTSNAEEAKVEWFYEDLQDFLELTPQRYILFVIEDWNAKVGSQEIPRVTGKFDLGVQNEAGQG